MLTTSWDLLKKRGFGIRVAITWQAMELAWQISLAMSQHAIYVKKRGFKVRWMTWQATGLADIARQSRDTSDLNKRGLKMRGDGVAGNACQALP